MGVDLAIFPKWLDKDQWKWTLCYERLACDRDYDFFAQIQGFTRSDVRKPKGQIPTHPLPTDAKVQVYGDEGLKDEAKDPYGSPLTYVLAGDFAKLKANTPHNRAIVAFAAALEPDWPIILWWH